MMEYTLDDRYLGALELFALTLTHLTKTLAASLSIAIEQAIAKIIAHVCYFLAICVIK